MVGMADEPLPHVKKTFEMRNQILDICEKCSKNKSKERKFNACKIEFPINYPFQECKGRIPNICIDCGSEFEMPVISYLWMSRCPECFKRVRFVKGIGVKYRKRGKCL